MAAGKINLQKASGGITAITGVDGASNTNLVLPESGTVATTSDINTAGVELKTIATGTATFTATTNNIKLTGIGIGVEIGDVIQISGANDAKNNSEFTIEVITDNDNIIVNQAHANKGTTKNVAARSGDMDVTVKLLSKWYNAPIGLGQGWVDMIESRTIDVVYTNTTGKPIEISFSATNSNISGWLGIKINGALVVQTTQSYGNAVGVGGLNCTIPNAYQYQYVKGSASVSGYNIWELR